MRNRRPASKAGFWTQRAAGRKERQEDRKLMSQKRPGHSNFKRKRTIYLSPADRRHALYCNADQLRFGY